MTLGERLASFQARLHQIEAEKRQIAEQAMAVDIALVKLQGAIALLEELIAEVPDGQ